MDHHTETFATSSPPRLEPDLPTDHRRDDEAHGRPKPRPSEGLAVPRPPEIQVSKMKHLKKEDGEPLWRRDIQYDLLKHVFDNPLKVFTNSYEPHKPKQCFADLYIDTMSRSSKTSKVLRDKLLSDRVAAKSMAMVCLLVNVNRMNTTLNFFPEMRAQLRTYHSIPSLQAHQDPHAYKQLQDAPRLKSILKGGVEDRAEPRTIDMIKDSPVPRTNPVNLLFVICEESAKIAELHFPLQGDFTDLILRTHVTSESRARALLWIVWFYLESDFTEEGCMENPFGEGVDYGLEVANQGIPEVVIMTPEQEEAENVDTPEEIDFGKTKQAMRKKIIESDQQNASESQTKKPKPRAEEPPNAAATSGILPRIRPSKNESDVDSTRSTPPPKGRQRDPNTGGGTGVRRGAPIKYQIYEGSSPGAPDKSIHEGGGNSRKARPPTAHQVAAERSRSERVDKILAEGLEEQRQSARERRLGDGAVLRAIRRNAEMLDPFADSDDEETVDTNKQQQQPQQQQQQQQQQQSRGNRGHGQVVADARPRAVPVREFGLGGIVPLADEPDDFGEEAAAYRDAIRRADKALGRKTDLSNLDESRPAKRPRLANGNGLNGDETMRDPDETEDDADETYDQMASMVDDPDDVETSFRPNRNGKAVVAPPPPQQQPPPPPPSDAAARARAAQAAAKRRTRERARLRQIAAQNAGKSNIAADDDLDDAERELLGLRSGAADEDDGPNGHGENGVAPAGASSSSSSSSFAAAAANGAHFVPDNGGAGDEEEQEDLDDMEKTLLGKMDTDSDSD